MSVIRKIQLLIFLSLFFSMGIAAWLTFRLASTSSGVIALLGSITLILTLWISPLILKKLLSPLALLEEGTKQIREGNFDYEIPQKTQDEFGKLTQAFNLMTANIKKLNKELEHRNADLEASNKELETFSYSVSHDLRSPLNSIHGFTQILQEDYSRKLDEDGKDCLQSVMRAAKRMGEIIDDLLKLSQINRAEIRKEDVDLTNMIKEIVAGMQRVEPERRVELLVQEDVSGYGDARLVRIILENLLGNAWKYTSKHPNAKIEFGKTMSNGEAAYFVKDDGAGFDIASVGKIFSPFQRLHSEKEFKGTGIGLATVQRIVHRHGGRIWAEAEQERGATFYFTLSRQEKS